MKERSVSVGVTGRVQGVGFRAWTEDRARAHGLSGWVRNEPDGSVAVCLSGPAEAVEAMLAELREGPRFSRVETVEVAPAERPDAGFRVRR